MGSIPSTEVNVPYMSDHLQYDIIKNFSEVNRTDMNQTQHRAFRTGWLPSTTVACPSPPQDKIGQDRQLWIEWVFHLPSKLGNLWELFAVT